MPLTTQQETDLLALLNTHFPALQTLVGTKANSSTVTALTTTVNNNKTAAEARIVKLEKYAGMHVEDHTPAASPTVPTDGVTVDDVDYVFTLPTFQHKNRTYVAQEIVDAPEDFTTLLEELIALQTKGEEFVPGLLALMEE